MKSLKEQMITKGMGSGIPHNQKLAGASDPVSAARLASSGKELAHKERQAFLEEEISRKLAIINEAKDIGFEPSVDVGENSTKEEIEQVYTEAEDWEKNKIEEDVQEQFEEYSIPVDDPLYNPIRDTKRRREIEKNLEPLDFESMIFSGFSSQKIRIRENFEIVFRTLNTNQSLWIESMTLDLQEKSVQYGRHWMSLVQLAVSLESINGKQVNPVISRFYKASQEQDFRKALDARMDYIGQLPQVVSDDLIIQYAWFSARVRKMMAGDVVAKVGNY